MCHSMLYALHSLPYSVPRTNTGARCYLHLHSIDKETENSQAKELSPDYIASGGLRL